MNVNQGIQQQQKNLSGETYGRAFSNQYPCRSTDDIGHYSHHFLSEANIN